MGAQIELKVIFWCQCCSAFCVRGLEKDEQKPKDHRHPQLCLFRKEMSTVENVSLRFLPGNYVHMQSQVNSSWEENISPHERN